MRRAIAVLSLYAIQATGCRDAVSPESAIVASLHIAPRELSLAANGGQASIVVAGTNTQGAYMPYAPRVLVFARDTSVASVEAPLVITGRQAGNTYLIVQSADVPARARDSVLVRVGSFQPAR